MNELNIPTDPREFQDFASQLFKSLENKDHQIADLRSLIFQMKKKTFGSSSEILTSEQMDFIFDESEITSNLPKEEQKEFETITYERKKAKKGRKAIPDYIPREEVIEDIPEEERTCPHGVEYKIIGSEDSERLKYTPAELKVIRTKRIKRACDCVECSAIKTAAVPPSVIPKSISTPSLLTFILISKYVDHLSLYRISNIFTRLQLNLPRQTLANWMIKVGFELNPLINLLEDHLLGGDYIFCDETRVQVLKEVGKTAQSKSQMWVRARNGPQPIVLFDYDPTRNGDVADRLLEGFKGYLHVDGYSGYNGPSSNEYVVRVADMYHIRRKFKDTYDEAKKNSGDTETPLEFLRFIKKLAKIENILEGESDFTRFHTRLKRSKPVMDKMKEWLDKKKRDYRPTSSLGKAVNYTLGQWTDMMMYLSHGKLEITTNFVENSIRPFALGRRNWLFSNSVEGAKSSANIYSLIETAKKNGLDPYQYIQAVLEKLPLAKTVDDFEDLLPWNIKLD